VRVIEDGRDAGIQALQGRNEIPNVHVMRPIVGSSASVRELHVRLKVDCRRQAAQLARPGV
jgi:hypothetical protein